MLWLENKNYFGPNTKLFFFKKTTWRKVTMWDTRFLVI